MVALGSMRCTICVYKSSMEGTVLPNLPDTAQATRAAILDAALTLASSRGLEGLSIGALAEVITAASAKCECQ